jgi:hypothetical protein
LAWAICGFAEQLEFLRDVGCGMVSDFKSVGGGGKCRQLFTKAATATADFYLTNCSADGIPMWDTGAPSLHHLPRSYLNKPANPYNEHEPVDSSAAVIAAQGLWRLGGLLMKARYRQAALTILKTALNEPYLATDSKHQGLLLHSVYHRPNGWDYIAPGQSVPNGESSMWGDYHLRELALLILREARGEVYPTFFGGVPTKLWQST